MSRKPSGIYLLLAKIICVMKNLFKNLSLSALLIAFVHVCLSAQDVRLEQSLNALGLKYTFDESQKTYKLLFNLDNGRSQIIFVNANVYELNSGFKIREIFSPVAKLENKSDFSHRMLFTILEKNYEYKIGNWQIFGGDPPYLLLFSIKVPPDISNNFLRELLIIAARRSDEMEKDLTGTDDY
ncbi:MAG: hypothetical protein ACK4KT_01950 [Thermaurantimonas sp.]